MFAHTIRNPHGQVTRGDEQGRLVEVDTLKCPHCGQHFEVIPGSGRERGFCRNCTAVTCGAPACCECVPFKRKMELIRRKAGMI